MRICVLPGDGIGPEVTRGGAARARRPLRRASASPSSWTSARSAAPRSTPTGDPFPDATREACLGADAVLLGRRRRPALGRRRGAARAGPARAALACSAATPTCGPPRRYTRHTTSPLRDELVDGPRPRDRARADRRHLLRRARARRRRAPTTPAATARSRSAASCERACGSPSAAAARVTSVDKANVLATSQALAPRRRARSRRAYPDVDARAPARRLDGDEARRAARPPTT